MNGDTYNFKVVARNVPEDVACHFELLNKKGEVVQSSSNGEFSDVPGSETGTYTVRLVDSNNKRIVSLVLTGFKEQNKPNPAPGPKMLISKADFQKKLLDKNDMDLVVARKVTDKKKLLAKGFKLVVVGINPEEKKVPTDLEGVREKIQHNIWKSAEVNNISYDEKTGQVTEVVIKPIYVE